MTTSEGVRRNARVVALYRMRKADLAAHYRQISNHVWSPVPPEKWNKDQLVSDILQIEFPNG